MTAPLKPCPFCGCNAMVEQWRRGVLREAKVRCCGCNVSTDFFASIEDGCSEIAAIRAWNRRAANAERAGNAGAGETRRT